MTWLGQVRHVMAKDVRQTRWSLLVYAGFVLVAMAQAIQTWPMPPASFGIPTYLVVLMGVFVTVLVVQADSPTRADAFWASRPLYPSAVLVAKVLLALIVLFGFALLAQSMVFAWLGEPPPVFVRHVARSSWIYALWLIIAMVTAAVTRDLRTSITTLAVVPLVFSFTRISWLLAPHRLAIPRVALAAIAGVGAVLAVALLVRLHRTRDTGRTTWAVAVVAIVATMLGIVTDPWARPGRHAVEQRADRYNFYVELMDGPTGIYGLQFGVPALIEADRMTVVDSAVIRIRLNDGNTMVFGERPLITVAYPTLPLPKGTNWLGGPPTDRSGDTRSIRTNRHQLDSLRAGVASASIEVWTWGGRPSVLATLPLRPGASQRRGGKIIRVVDVGRRIGEDSLASIWMTWAAPVDGMISAERNILSYRSPQFALANLPRGEAVVPSQRQAGGTVSSMVLPGLRKNVTVAALNTGIQAYRHQPPPTLDQAWFDQASVVVYDWTLTGRTRTRVENVEVRVRHLPNATERRPPVTGTFPASR